MIDLKCYLYIYQKDFGSHKKENRATVIVALFLSQQFLILMFHAHSKDFKLQGKQPVFFALFTGNMRLGQYHGNDNERAFVKYYRSNCL